MVNALNMAKRDGLTERESHRRRKQIKVDRICIHFLK